MCTICTRVQKYTRGANFGHVSGVLRKKHPEAGRFAPGCKFAPPSEVVQSDANLFAPGANLRDLFCMILYKYNPL